VLGERYNEEEIFNMAIRFESQAERDEYLAKVCRDSSKLRADVEALLRAHDAESFLDGSAFCADVALGDITITEGPGTVIGRYKLLEKIGEGGMAVVYMAEQEQPIRRKVALKIIKLGMDTRQVIARFEVERQALAMMDHHNIAKVLDAGATETGRPYFVMELVTGVSITDYCDKNSLSTKDRLDLFIQVCNAVQHAHQKGIIHRDIKPSNVMVTHHDGKPVPKVIDFGIAKAINQRLTEKTLFTRYAHIIGTPAYMSPEQAELSDLDVDTRTDIYSLGVLLYELLTGTTPFSEEELRKAGYIEMQRVIREQEPAKPSTKLSTLGGTLTDIAKRRNSTPDLLRKAIRGDLDWIVMKSLEKDRARRYETANGLAEDIERHLRHEPVLAGSPGTIYRLRKLVRKHRIQVMMSACVAALAFLGLFAGEMYRRQHNAASVEAEAHLLRAQELISHGQYQDAMKEVSLILEDKHLGTRARLLHARLILESRGPVQAIKELQGLLDEPNEIASQACFLLARILLENDPVDPRARRAWADRAREYHLRGTQLFSETAEAYFNRAIMAGTVSQSLESLQQAVELDPGHYPSHHALATIFHLLRDFESMEREAYAMLALRKSDPAGYNLLAVALRNLGLSRHSSELLAKALKNHNRAVALSQQSPDVYDERSQTRMEMGLLDQALGDAKTCVSLRPQEALYCFRVYSLLLALGRYDEAAAIYERARGLPSFTTERWNAWCFRHVSDAIVAGRPWHPQDSEPEGNAFWPVLIAEKHLRQLPAKARRVVQEGFHPSWSPDGTKIVYSRGMVGASAVEILDLESGQTHLVTCPGKDPEWSPDGRYIAYVRDRHVLPLDVLDAGVQVEGVRDLAALEEQVWLVRADGKGNPFYVGDGGYPSWDNTSKRVFYSSRHDCYVYSLMIDPNVIDGPSQQDTSPDSRGPRRRFEPEALVYTGPSWYPVVSPDGKYVACRQHDSAFQVVDIAAKSLLVERIGSHSFGNVSGWSKDQREVIVGLSWYGGLWVYDLSTQDYVKVLKGSFGKVSWSPDPNKPRLAMACGSGGIGHVEIWIADLQPGMSTIQSLGALTEDEPDDIPRFPGGIRYEHSSDTYTLVGSGWDIWATSDEFHYAHKELTGNGSIVARIDRVDHVDDWTKAGIMIRETLGPNSKFAAVYITPVNRFCFQYRPVTGAITHTCHTDPNAVTLPHWVRLIRQGNTFRAQHSSDGLDWKDFEGGWTITPITESYPAVAQVAMNGAVYIGLALSSHAGPLSAQAKMSHVTVTGKVDPAGPFSRSEDIGSEVIKEPKK